MSGLTDDPATHEIFYSKPVNTQFFVANRSAGDWVSSAASVRAAGSLGSSVILPNLPAGKESWPIVLYAQPDFTSISLYALMHDSHVHEEVQEVFFI